MYIGCAKLTCGFIGTDMACLNLQIAAASLGWNLVAIPGDHDMEVVTKFAQNSVWLQAHFSQLGIQRMISNIWEHSEGDIRDSGELSELLRLHVATKKPDKVDDHVASAEVHQLLGQCLNDFLIRVWAFFTQAGLNGISDATRNSMLHEAGQGLDVLLFASPTMEEPELDEQVAPEPYDTQQVIVGGRNLLLDDFLRSDYGPMALCMWPADGDQEGSSALIYVNESCVVDAAFLLLPRLFQHAYTAPDVSRFETHKPQILENPRADPECFREYSARKPWVPYSNENRIEIHEGTTYSWVPLTKIFAFSSSAPGTLAEMPITERNACGSPFMLPVERGNTTPAKKKKAVRYEAGDSVFVIDDTLIPNTQVKCVSVLMASGFEGADEMRELKGQSKPRVMLAANTTLIVQTASTRAVTCSAPLTNDYFLVADDFEDGSMPRMLEITLKEGELKLATTMVKPNADLQFVSMTKATSDTTITSSPTKADGEKTAAKKPAAEKDAVGKDAAEQTGREKADVEKAATEKAVAEKAVAEKAAAEMANREEAQATSAKNADTDVASAGGENKLKAVAQQLQVTREATLKEGDYVSMLDDTMQFENISVMMEGGTKSVKRTICIKEACKMQVHKYDEQTKTVMVVLHKMDPVNFTIHEPRPGEELKAMKRVSPVTIPLRAVQPVQASRKRPLDKDATNPAQIKENGSEFEANPPSEQTSVGSKHARQQQGLITHHGFGTGWATISPAPPAPPPKRMAQQTLDGTAIAASKQAGKGAAK